MDGIFVPASPGQLLLEGSFDHNVKVMNGHQSNEGPVFTRPDIKDDANFESLIQFWVPSAKAQDVAYISNSLYPAMFDSTYPYRNHLDRAILFVSEYIITCKTNWLDRAFQNKTYGYVFSVPPGLHAQDTEYTFYNGPGTTDMYGTYNGTVAQGLQQYVMKFVATGNPSGGSAFPAFPVYGSGTILNLSDAGFPEIPDPTANERCIYWQKEPYKDDTTPGKKSTNGSSSSWGGDLWKTIATIVTGFIVL